MSAELAIGLRSYSPLWGDRRSVNRQMAECPRGVNLVAALLTFGCVISLSPVSMPVSDLNCTCLVMPGGTLRGTPWYALCTCGSRAVDSNASVRHRLHARP